MRLRHLSQNLAMVAVLGALAASSMSAQRMRGGGAAAAAPLKVTPVATDVYLVSGGAGANTGFVVGTNGVIVIDAKMTADSARQMLAEIAKVTPKPVTHVILTQSDAEDVNGLAGFPKGLTIISHENAKNEIKDLLDELGKSATPEMAALRDYLPTQTVTKNQDLTIDGVRVRLLHFAAAHTAGDLMVYLPQQKILFAGEILSAPGRFPNIDRGRHGSVKGWVENAKGAVALHATAYVPARGDVQMEAVVAKSAADTDAKRAEVAKLFASGKSYTEVREALKEKDNPEFGAGPSFTQTIYRELSAAQPFDPHDLSGFYTARGSQLPLAGRHEIGPNVPAMTPWAQARYDAAKPGLNGTGAGRAQPLGNDPIMICDPVGYPRVLVASGGYGMQIVQAPKETMVLFDWFYGRRDIYTDGRKLSEDSDNRFYGNSVGHWEGDTFVVQSNNFDDRTWLDSAGHPHSTDMTMTERYRRLDHDTIELTMVLNDPKAYASEWVAEKHYLERFPDDELKARDSGWDDLREDVCIPSVEAKYKDEVREPAGGAKKP
jgi:glyoxylase-like metal-dependent hydrolase (beta-lactamase superfamily II)